ncbi:MAG: hypothetical protein AAF212_08005 [Verrucomicrobiota bacterium]
MKIYHAFLLTSALGAPFILHSQEKEEPTQYEEEHDEASVREEITEFFENEDGRELTRFLRAQLNSEVISVLKTRIQNEPFEAREWLEHLYDIKLEYEMFEEEDPEFAALFLQFQKHEINTFVYSAKLEHLRRHRGSEAEAQELRSKLQSEITTAFDLKFEMQTQELRHLKREVLELESLLERRKGSKAQIIERRFNALSGQEDHLEW